MHIGQTVIALKDIYQDIDGRSLRVWELGFPGTIRRISDDGSLMLVDYDDCVNKYCAVGICPEDVEVVPADWTAEQIIERGWDIRFLAISDAIVAEKYPAKKETV
jgi:hypothetical protein